MKKESEQLVSIGRVHDGGHFEKSLREELIRAIEDGVPRSVIAYQYGVSRTAISGWMRDHSSKEYRARQCGAHLTAVEKRSIVRLVERGELTPHAARKEHGINGTTLNKWLKASSRENAELAVYDPFEMKNKPELPDPEKEALKKALEEAQMKINALNTLIDVAQDQFKIAIRKKAGARQSKS
jgi:transposase-like protein